MMLYNGKPFPPPMQSPHWLDRVIADQAAYYGNTVEREAERQRTAARLQEIAEFEQWERDS